MNKIYLDPALREFGELLNQVVRALRASPNGVPMNKLFPPQKVAYCEAMAQLDVIDLSKQKTDMPGGHTSWIRPGGLSLKNLRRIIKGVNLVYWYLLAGDSETTSVEPGNDDLLKHLLDIYELPSRFFTGIGLVLSASGLTRNNKGRLELLPGNMRAASIREARRIPHSKATGPLRIPMESELYKGLGDFFQEHSRSRKEGEFCRWKYIYQEKKHNRPVKNAGGDWVNPDLAGCRLTENEFTGLPALEVMAVEVKRKEYKSGGKNRVNHLRKSWIAQSESYFQFANIVYLAINTTYTNVLTKKTNLSRLVKQGIGLLLLSDPEDPESWYEALPPIYRMTRTASATPFLKSIFADQIKNIRRDLSGEYKTETTFNFTAQGGRNTNVK